MNFSQRKTAFGERILIVRTDKFNTWTGIGWDVRYRDMGERRADHDPQELPPPKASLKRVKMARIMSFHFVLL